MDIDLLETMRTNGAARAFLPDPVPDEAVARILDAARFAPSGGNKQPWRVILVKDQALRAELQESVSLGWREYAAFLAAGLQPFPAAWPGAERADVDLEAARAAEIPLDFCDRLTEHPVVMVVLADLSKLAIADGELDRQSIVGGGSIYPFIQNILLAARSEGLSGVLSTWVCRDELRARELLGVPDGWAIAAVVVLGKPVKQLTKLRRNPVDSFASVDRFAGSPLPAPGS